MPLRSPKHVGPLPTQRRAELTFKHNLANGRHGWLRLTPAYSVKVVEDILSRHEHEDERLRILDPFSGTGTTPLSAAMHGHDAVAVDLNPFLVWLGKIKVSQYSDRILQEALECACEVERSAGARGAVGVPPPSLHNIDRWWSPRRLEFLCRLMGAIRTCAEANTPVRDLLLVAFCRTMIGLSNAAFNHQSMSFKTSGDNGQGFLFDTEDNDRYSAHFKDDVNRVLRGAAENPSGEASVLLGDARTLDVVKDESFDFVVTSPPYPNRMSYIRELRPYMYWLGYLKNAREAGDLDWEAIGGTWGIATSRVASWKQDSSNHLPKYLLSAIARIRSSNAKSGGVLANYVAKYFVDMRRHLSVVVPLVRRGGTLHYVVGNSKFYDVLVPVERVYRDMLIQAGSRDVQIVPLRKRNSKKELVEFDVVATV